MQPPSTTITKRSELLVQGKDNDRLAYQRGQGDEVETARSFLACALRYLSLFMFKYLLDQRRFDARDDIMWGGLRVKERTMSFRVFVVLFVSFWPSDDLDKRQTTIWEPGERPEGRKTKRGKGG